MVKPLPRWRLQTGAYEAIDDIDTQSRRPDFIVPVYGARMVNLETSRLRKGMELNKESPPAFIVHAFDDFVPVQNALVLARLYKEAGVPVECHVFDSGGHGFGARYVEEFTSHELAEALRDVDAEPWLAGEVVCGGVCVWCVVRIQIASTARFA